MDERGIIIADRDADFRRQVAEYFRKAGYEVETTDSTVHVLCSILQKKTPVLLLGSDFDQKVSSSDLIHLLKKCNRHLNVIMVSDDLPLTQARQVRKAGIFYQAMKPVENGDTEELGLAVECAFKTYRANRQQERMEAAMRRRAHRRESVAKQPASVSRRFSWLIALAVLIFGTSFLALSAAESVQRGGNLGIWLFLGFCALLVVAQFFPVFRIKLPHRIMAQQAAKEQAASSDKKSS
ncbi:histidine kinase [Geomonas sp. Red69]|uniref:response regulator n=1 Tax=Geomonas diazotrophica TaxID=2843197 RepID=UPI001C10DC07|nr:MULTISPECIES: response regulator [Geomonas]MBU5635634.1 histidine kinase [Geomonas diazotrophica]QXE87255.1 histidine kinase [Geomonas nitrogeniifigens]